MVDANLATSAGGPVAVEEATGDVDLAGPVEVDGEDVTGTAPSVLADGDDRSERSVADVCAAVAFDVQVSARDAGGDAVADCAGSSLARVDPILEIGRASWRDRGWKSV